MIQKFSELTEQELFDKVAKHLLAQNKKSYKSAETECTYRSPEGLKCAAGCLIEDDEYLPLMEDKTWSRLCAQGYAKTDHRDLIDRLQKIHDLYEPEEWRDQLRDAAAHLALKFNETI